MKILSICLLGLLIIQCKIRKATQHAESSLSIECYTGIVHVAEEGCPYYLEIPEALNPGKAIDFKRVYPVNLKDSMKKKGLKVSFNYYLTKAMNPEGCAAEAVVQIDHIEVIP
jgi:hypothetical protein